MTRTTDVDLRNREVEIRRVVDLEGTGRPSDSPSGACFRKSMDNELSRNAKSNVYAVT